jgi:hypothetical protein
MRQRRCRNSSNLSPWQTFDLWFLSKMSLRDCH